MAIEKRLAAADLTLGAVIDLVKSQVGAVRPPLSKSSPFEALLRAIIYQRMAAKAAGTIYNRRCIYGML